MTNFIKVKKRYQLILIIFPLVVSVILIFLNIVSVHPLFKKYFLIEGEVSEIYEERLYERTSRYYHGYVNNLIVIINDTIKLKFSKDEYWETQKQTKLGSKIEVIVSTFDYRKYENNKHQIGNYYDEIYKLVLIKIDSVGIEKREIIYDHSSHSGLLIFFISSIFIVIVSIYTFLCSLFSFILSNFTLEERKEISWLPKWLKNHSDLDDTSPVG